MEKNDNNCQRLGKTQESERAARKRQGHELNDGQVINALVQPLATTPGSAHSTLTPWPSLLKLPRVFGDE